MVSVRQRRRSRVCGSAALSSAGTITVSKWRPSRSVMPIVSAMSRPPSAPAAAIFAVRLMSVLAPEAADPFACLGLDRSVARGFERLSAALGGDRGGGDGALLRLEREKLVGGLRRVG